MWLAKHNTRSAKTTAHLAACVGVTYTFVYIQVPIGSLQLDAGLRAWTVWRSWLAPPLYRIYKSAAQGATAAGLRAWTVWRSWPAPPPAALESACPATAPAGITVKVCWRHQQPSRPKSLQVPTQSLWGNLAGTPVASLQVELEGERFHM